MAEGGGLLNRYRVKSSIGGSNPPLSAIALASTTQLVGYHDGYQFLRISQGDSASPFREMPHEVQSCSLLYTSLPLRSRAKPSCGPQASASAPRPTWAGSACCLRFPAASPCSRCCSPASGCTACSCARSRCGERTSASGSRSARRAAAYSPACTAGARRRVRRACGRRGVGRAAHPCPYQAVCAARHRRARRLCRGGARACGRQRHVTHCTGPPGCVYQPHPRS